MEKWKTERSQEACTLWSEGKLEVGRQVLFLLLGELYCPSKEPVTNSQLPANLCILPLRKLTTVWLTNSQSCSLAQEEEQDLKSGDHSCVCFPSLAYLLISVVGCGRGSTMKLDDSMLNYRSSLLCLSSSRDWFPLESMGWIFEDTQRSHPPCGPPKVKDTIMNQYGVERW